MPPALELCTQIPQLPRITVRHPYLKVLLGLCSWKLSSRKSRGEGGGDGRDGKQEGSMNERGRKRGHEEEERYRA